MIAPGTAAVISSGIAAASAATTQGLTAARNRRQFRNQVKLWNMNNAYNTPTNQRQRMLDAGLNPIGADMASGNTSQMASAPQMFNEPVDLSPSVQNALNIQQAQANIDLVNEQKKGQELQNYITEHSKDYQVQLFGKQVELAQNTIGMNDAQKELYQSQSVAIAQQLENDSRRIDNEESRIMVERKIARIKEEELKIQKSLSDSQISKNAQDVINSIAQVQLYSAQASLMNEQERTQAEKTIEAKYQAIQVKLATLIKELTFDEDKTSANAKSKTDRYKNEIAQKDTESKWYNRTNGVDSRMFDTMQTIEQAIEYIPMLGPILQLLQKLGG